MSSHHLVCIGNVTIDEAVQPSGARTVAPGGDVIFAALAARAHLDEVSWLAPIGTDLPAEMLRELDAAGLTAIEAPPRALPTVRNVVTYRGDGSRCWELVHGEEHFDAMSVYPSDVTPAVLGADAILVLGMSVGAQVALLPWLRRNTAASIYLDLQEDGLAGHEAALRAIIGLCDVFLPSESEAVVLAETADLAAAARSFRELGPQVVVIKRAERGCLVQVGSDTAIEVPVDVVNPVDATGAGDAFCGAFAAVHVAGGDPLSAARAGSSAARVAIGAPGILGLLPGSRERVTIG